MTSTGKNQVLAFLVAAISIVTSTTALSDLDVDQHMAGSPNTAGHLRWNFEPCPGTMSVITGRSFFFNTLSVGIGSQLEVGTVPILNVMNGRNWTIKWNPYRSERFSIGGAWLRYFSNSSAGQTAYSDGVSLLGATGLSADTVLSASLSTDIYSSTNKDVNNVLHSIDRPYEKFVDLSRRFGTSWNWTWGLSHTVNYLQPPGDWRKKKYEWGAGGTLAWHPRETFVSKLALGGHYFLSSKRNIYLISFGF